MSQFADIDDAILPVLKFITGESENICRLCFGGTEDGPYLDESRILQSPSFDGKVTFRDMLREIGADIDPSLPQILCEPCADSATTAFLFLKVCQQSKQKWQGTIDKLSYVIQLTDKLSSSIKSVYLSIQNENSTDNDIIFTSRNKIDAHDKLAIVSKFKNLIKRKNYLDKCRIDEMKAIVICQECGEQFPSRRRLISHMKKHQLTHTKYQCKECPKMFSCKLRLRDHSERVHAPKTIKCSKCPKMFSTERVLRSHEAKAHQAVICKLCFIQLPSKNHLRQHLDRHDVQTCPKCNKKFRHISTFKPHLKICGNEEERKVKFFCDLCDKGYVWKNTLRSHIVTDHGFGRTRLISCNWCKRKFDAMSKLKTHIVKHTRERNYHCEQCGGQFVTLAALKYHYRLHTGERPYACDLCDQKFLSASRRMEHKRRKHLGPDKECTICGNKYITTHELRKHTARHNNPQSKLFVPSKASEHKVPNKNPNQQQKNKNNN